MKIHQIKIDFHVTEQISRFVYVYLLEADSLYLIDSGVFGCEKQIMDYLDSIGRDISDIKGIFLTHAHPDHIGSAVWFQEHTGCKIYASEGEKRWIEDIDLQFKERPIPIFIDEQELRKTLHILKDTKGVKTYYPAWDQTYTAEMMDSKLIEAGELVDLLKKTVSELDDGSGLSVLVDRVCDRLKMPMLKSNPLFGRTIECLRQEA